MARFKKTMDGNEAAAPASDSISKILTVLPKIFFLPAVAHSSVCSAIGDDGVIG